MADKTHLTEVAHLLERLKDKHPSETNAFLNFMNKAEGGPALMHLVPLLEALDEFSPEPA